MYQDVGKKNEERMETTLVQSAASSNVTQRQCFDTDVCACQRSGLTGVS